MPEEAERIIERGTIKILGKQYTVQNRKREWRQSAESASPTNAMIRGARTYDVANVVQVTK